MTNDTGNAQVTFLVVDDDEIFCEVLSRALQRRGFNVLSALSVDQACQHIARKRPDLAVVDLRIGQDSGLSLVRDLAALSPPARAVVLTGYGSIATAFEAIKLGAVQYLTKPVEVDEILKALQETAAPTGEAPVTQPKPGLFHSQSILQICISYCRCYRIGSWTLVPNYIDLVGQMKHLSIVNVELQLKAYWAAPVPIAK